MINNVVLVSGVQQSNSVTYIYIYIYILYQILLPRRLLQNIVQSSLCYTVGPCWLSILNIAVGVVSDMYTICTPKFICYFLFYYFYMLNGILKLDIQIFSLY